MPAEVESLAYVSNKQNGRFVPWHGLGTAVENAMTSAEALELGGLDWNVTPRPVFTDNHIQIPGYVANTRDTDDQILGIVTNKYKIVQNKEAFEFTDHLIGDDVRYETVGSLRGGKSVFLLAQMPKEKILGDDIQPYLCFTNTHDGTGAIKIALTPIRVVCCNTLNLAMSSAKRVWSCKHMGNLEGRMHEAAETLELAHNYMENLDVTAQRLANTTISNDTIREIVAEMFPIDESATDRIQANMKKAKDEFMIAYFMPDIAQFRNTAWGLVNAMSDMVGHSSPVRNTPTYAERNFERIIYGHPLLDAIVEKCNVAV